MKKPHEKMGLAATNLVKLGIYIFCGIQNNIIGLCMIVCSKT